MVEPEEADATVSSKRLGLSDAEKWLIIEFLQEQEKERDERRHRRLQIGISAFALVSAALVTWVLTTISSSSRSVDAIAAEVRKRADEIEQRAVSSATEKALNEVRSASLVQALQTALSNAFTTVADARAEARSAEEEARKLRAVTLQETEKLREVAVNESAQLRETTATIVAEAEGQLKAAQAAKARAEAASPIIEAAARKLEQSAESIAAVAVADPNFQQIVAAKVASIPRETIAFFALRVCPEGWREFEPLRGRYPLGLLAGGTPGRSVGQALSEGEDRPAGRHEHEVPNIWVPAGDPGKPGDRGGLQAGGSVGRYLETRRTTGPQAVPPGTNAPYVQLLACRKE